MLQLFQRGTVDVFANQAAAIFGGPDGKLLEVALHKSVFGGISVKRKELTWDDDKLLKLINVTPPKRSAPKRGGKYDIICPI